MGKKKKERKKKKKAVATVAVAHHQVTNHEPKQAVTGTTEQPKQTAVCFEADRLLV